MFRHKKTATGTVPATAAETHVNKQKKAHPIRHGVFLAVLYFVAYYAASIGVLLLIEPFTGGLADFLMQVFLRLPLGYVFYKKLRTRLPVEGPVRLPRRKVLAMLAAHLFLVALPMKLAHKGLFLSVSTTGASDSLVYLLNLFIFAPVVEELIFRGVWFPLIRKNLPFWPAAIVNGLMFGLAHFSNAGNMISAAFLGVTACMLYEATGTIRYGMYLHYLFNGIGLPMILMDVSLPGSVTVPLYVMAVVVQLAAYLNRDRIVGRLLA